MIFSWVKIFVCVSFFQLPIGTYRGHQTGPEELKRVPAEANVSQVEFYPQIVELAAKWKWNVDEYFSVLRARPFWRTTYWKLKENYLALLLVSISLCLYYSRLHITKVSTGSICTLNWINFIFTVFNLWDFANSYLVQIHVTTKLYVDFYLPKQPWTHKNITYLTLLKPILLLAANPSFILSTKDLKHAPVEFRGQTDQSNWR